MGAIIALMRHDLLFLQFCLPLVSEEAQSCSERDDVANPWPFDQMKLFSQSIFRCHISLGLIHAFGSFRGLIYHHQGELPGSPDH